MRIVHKISTKYIVFLSLLLSVSAYSQNTQDLMEYIKSNITRYPSAKNMQNYIFFKDDILQFHLSKFTGKEVSDEVFPFIFIFGVEIHEGSSLLNEIKGEFAETIDLRAIRKIETVHNSKSEFPSSKLLLYLRDGYLAKVFYKEGSYEEIKELDGIMEITIENNKNVAEKIKKAFFKLGENLNIEITDGDLY